MFTADDLSGIDCRVGNLGWDPPPWHSGIPQGIDLGLLVQQMEKPQRIIP
jgi:hypothetical protein